MVVVAPEAHQVFVHRHLSSSVVRLIQLDCRTGVMRRRWRQQQQQQQQGVSRMGESKTASGAKSGRRCLIAAANCCLQPLLLQVLLRLKRGPALALLLSGSGSLGGHHSCWLLPLLPLRT